MQAGEIERTRKEALSASRSRTNDKELPISSARKKKQKTNIERARM